MKKRITIPFDLLSIEGDGFHLLVEALLNGRPAKMLIDTGASRTVFDKERITRYIPGAVLTPADKTHLPALVGKTIIPDDLFFVEGKCNSTLFWGHGLSPGVG